MKKIQHRQDMIERYVRLRGTQKRSIEATPGPTNGRKRSPAVEGDKVPPAAGDKVAPGESVAETMAGDGENGATGGPISKTWF